VRTLNLILLVLPSLLFPAQSEANPLDEATRLFEQANLKRLHAQQSRPGVSIDTFASDGCSGGLSKNWKILAAFWPELAHAIGAEPPWEQCCVAHDRDYWRGESINGFDKRLQADVELRQCVEQSGQEKSAAIAQRLGISQAEVVEVFNLTAELMFHAVRIGGGPCTGLDWRWGHGWPPCSFAAEPISDSLELVELNTYGRDFQSQALPVSPVKSRRKETRLRTRTLNPHRLEQ
jgi:hypothetical protein